MKVVEKLKKILQIKLGYQKYLVKKDKGQVLLSSSQKAKEGQKVTDVIQNVTKYYRITNRNSKEVGVT